MGGIQLLLLMTEEAHIDAAAGGDVDLIGPLDTQFPDHQDSNSCKEDKNGKLLPQPREFTPCPFFFHHGLI
jgi:hypothetical protein